MKKPIILYIILFLLCLPLCEAKAQEVLAWQDCIAEAQKNHPDLISAQESINEQKSGKAIVASGLFPQINANLDASINGSKTTNEITGVTTRQMSDSYSYGVSGQQLIFDGFKTMNEMSAASQNIKAAQYNYKFASCEVRLNLRTAFINLLKAQELIKVAQEIVRIRRDSLELITLRYESGLEHKGALLTAEANIAEADFELAQAKRSVELAQRQLTKEMGRREFKPMYVKADFTVRDSAKEKPDFEELVKNNPSLLQANAKTNAAAFNIKSAYADFYPEFSGQAGANKTGSYWPPRDEEWNLGLSLSMPIFEGGLRFAQVSQAQAAYNKAQADERSTKDAIIVALEQKWIALQDAIDAVEVQLKSLEAAQERSKIAEAQYSTGFITFDNWIIIENDLVNAKKSHLQAQANSLFAEANWVQAKGETLEYAQ